MSPTAILLRILAAGVTVVGAWQLSDRAAPIAVDAYRVETPVVPRGGVLEVSYHTTFFDRCSGRGARFFQDASGEVIPVEPYHFRDGIARDGQPIQLDSPAWVTIKAIVPDRATPGRARYQNVSDFWCTPAQRLMHDWPLIGSLVRITYPYPIISYEISPARAASAATAPETIFRPVKQDFSLRDALRAQDDAGR